MPPWRSYSAWAALRSGAGDRRWVCCAPSHLRVACIHLEPVLSSPHQRERNFPFYIFGFEMTKSRGIGRGGARPGSGRKPKAITPRLEALKDALVKCGAPCFGEADRRFVRAMIALGAPKSATAGAFGISEAELLAKFSDELGSCASDQRTAAPSPTTIPPLRFRRASEVPARGVSGNPAWASSGR
jgi:hypothetical protein